VASRLPKTPDGVENRADFLTAHELSFNLTQEHAVCKAHDAKELRAERAGTRWAMVAGVTTMWGDQGDDEGSWR